ncbi:protein-(glutamine-N5) methyltransferase, release factor-specific [Pasteurellaceae bacterium Pebbles2]|nr:protein-(glutamine-N5) methyltransferase, release factor-specific [Pasteurellaceae bacterium Pebbles2]
MTYQQWLKFAQETLAKGVEKDPYLDPKFDANLLLQWVTKKSKAQILAFIDTELDQKTQQKITALLQQRAAGEPMAYVLGEAEFWSLNLEVSKDTLIPRPDTEILVEQALSISKQILKQQNQIAILDLGTGTGAIALSLADELKKCGAKWRILGVDLLENAVALATRNGLRNHLPDVEFRQSSWFDNVLERFDLIVSNPPYIDQHDENLNCGDVRFEPLSALVADEQGYADLRKIIENAPQFLNEQGWLVLEHGWQQGEKVRAMLSQQGWQDIESLRDYGGNERITLAKWK